MLAAVAAHEVDGGAGKEHRAGNAHVACQAIVEGKPFHVGGTELFDGEDKHRARIADEVDEHDEETDVPPDAEAGNEAVEKDGLETQVGDVKAQALDEKPDEGVKAQCLVAEGDVCHHEHAGNNQPKQEEQGAEVAAHEYHQPEEGKDDKRHHAVELGEHPRGVAAALDVEYLDEKVLLDVAHHNEHEVGKEEHHEERHVASEEGKALRAVEGTAFRLAEDVLAGRGRKAMEAVAEEAKKGQGASANHCRHPKFADVEVAHDVKPDGFRRAGTDHHADAEEAGEEVGHAPPLDEAEYHAPHAAERQAVEEHGEHVPRDGKDGEEDERRLGNADGEKDEAQARLAAELGDNLDAKEFGKEVAQNLDDSDGNFIVHAAKGEPLEFRSGEGLAEGIDQRIREEGCPACPKDEKDV